MVSRCISEPAAGQLGNEAQGLFRTGSNGFEVLDVHGLCQLAAKNGVTVGEISSGPA